MAIVKSTAIGEAKNSLGQITFQTVKGRTIARQKPIHVANPRTEAQMTQREKLANLVAAWRAFFFQTRPYWTVIKGRGSAYNEFVSKNMIYGDQVEVEDGHLGNVPFDFYCSSGKYGETALSWQPRLYNRGEVGINDMQLREEIRKGDQINLIQFSSDTPTKTVIKTTILTDQDISTLKDGGIIEIEYDFPCDSIAVVYYSSARRISNTARMTGDV
ncbi:MAG TPA: hypothetical protein GXX70_09790 [Tepidimicrobium sp.]|nr:hypothetical protein [Tepidimicrobium sp.]